MNKIEGGPACEQCDGKGKIYILENETCLTCHGTGVKPLSEWTDAQKAEWLWDNGYEWRPRRRFHEDIKEYRVEIDFYSNEAQRTGMGMAEDFSAALTAAVECVAKEKK